MPKDCLLSGVAAGLVLLLASGGAAVAQTPSPEAGEGRLTFEDVFRDQRRLGNARFSPDGRRLSYGLSRFDAPTGGLAFPIAQHSAFVADLETGRTLTLTPGNPSDGTDAGAFLQPCEPWRPDGAGVGLITVQDGRPGFAYADADSGRITPLGAGSGSLCALWVGAHMVYATNDGGPPGGWESRRSLGWLQGRWETAWSGGPAQTTVHSSNPIFPAPTALADAGGLVVADTDTGEIRTIGSGHFTSLIASPDGRTFAAIREGRTDVAALSTDTGRRGELQVYRLELEGARLLFRLPDLDVGYRAMSWSPDGGRLPVGGKADDGALALRVVTVDTGGVEDVAVPLDVSVANASAGAREPFLPLGWIGDAPAFIGETATRRARSADARSEYGGNRDAGRGVFRVSDDGVEALTAFSTTSVEGFATTASGDGLVVADGALWRLAPQAPPARIAVSGYTVQGLAPAPGALGAQPQFQLAGRGETERAVVSAVDANGVSARLVVRLTDGAILLRTSASGLEDLSPDLDVAAVIRHEGWAGRLGLEGRIAREVTVTNPEWGDKPLGEAHHLTYEVDGKTLTGWVLTPPGYNGGALPTLVWVYGGQVFGAEPPRETRPEEAVTPVFSGQLWAANGYAVLYPSTPLGEGADVDVGDALAASVVAGVDAAVAAGFTDPARVGLFGHSFGGYSTTAILARRSDRFKAGAAISGIYDFVSAWGARQSWETLVDPDGYTFDLATKGYIENGQMRLGGPPWARTEAYLRASPLYRAPDIKTPLMLMVGDLDLGTTNLQQTERLYAALRRTGNPTVMVRYWGQRHVQEDPGAVRDEWVRLSAWFDHYLR